MSLSVLYLHQHHSAPGGATASRSWAMATALARAGHDVTLACGRYDGAATGLEGAFEGGLRRGATGPFETVEFDIPYGNAQRLAARGAAFLRFAAAASRLALSRRYDLVFASSTPLTVLLPALLARRLRGTPFVYEMRDPWPELPRALGGVPRPVLGGMELLANAACREAAAVVALSEGMAATALARGAARPRVHVVPNGCDLDLFGPQVPPWRPDCAAPWESLAVYAGAHGAANGLHLLIEAAAILAARGEKRVRLLLVGDGARKPALRAEALARGLPNLDFLDPLPKPRLAGLLAGSQIGIQCLAPVAAFGEWTSPNKLMDYLAAGLPVVSNLEGRAARILADGPCGITVPARDPAAMADALVSLAANPSRRVAFGSAARTQAVRKWDRRLLAERLVRVVEEAAAPRVAALLAPA
jgi:glycosyltransferase involved in cell wall biosynthesis